MSWYGTAPTPPHATPIRPDIQPRPTTQPFGNFFACLQALPVAEGVAVVGKIIEALHVMEREETRRHEILADKEVALARIAAGEKLMEHLVTREYDHKDLVAKAMGETLHTLAQAGHTEAALALSKLLVDTTVNGTFLQALLQFRNQHASVGLLEITTRPVSGV